MDWMNNRIGIDKKKTDFGAGCVFLARLGGAATSIVVLLCGLVSLLPLPSFTTSFSGYPRCLAVGFIFIMVSVAMFFMEVTILGECIEKLSFLKTLTKYLKHWHRAVFYMGISITPLVLWCLSTSTIIPMVLLFLIGALNFTLAMGQKLLAHPLLLICNRGDHSEQVAARWKRLNDNDDNEEEEEEEEEKEEENINNEIPA